MRLLAVLSCASFTFLSCNGSETDPVFGASTAASVSSERLSSWDQAARWGDHRDAGYLTAAEFAATPAASVTSTQVTSWDQAASWGDHSTVGYATTAQLAALPAAAITAADLSTWNTAAGWGNHATAGYLLSADFTASPAGSITAAQVTNWNDAFGWGNHASAGYQTTAAFAATPAAGITASQITDWNTAAARTETDPKVGTLTTNTVPLWDGTSLADSAIVQRGTNIGIGTTSPQGLLSVGTVAHLGKGLATNTSKTCAIAGFSWTNTPPSATACTSYCANLGFPAGVVGTQGSKSCGGASCNYISDFETCAVGTMGNNGNCNSCAANFVCTCLTPGAVFDVDVKLNAYLQLSSTTGSPPAADCDVASERGRMKVDAVANTLWLCTSTGWQAK